MYPEETCLHKLIEAQVNRTPQAAAVIFEGKQISYQELNQRANSLAHQLQALEVGPDVLVGICMERSLEMVIAMLGVLKAGGAYIPLDPTYPQERLNNLVDDARCPVLLTQQKLTSQLPIYIVDNCHATVIYLGDDWKGMSGASIENPLSDVLSTNLAYMMYTSGSTGKPKGAMITHQGICNQLLWTQETYKLTEEDRVLQRTPYSFGVSVLEIFWPLVTGACLVVARPEGHRDCSYLVEIIKSQQITTLEIVPSMLDVFLEAPGLEDCRSLRRVICGGEALPFEYQQRFFAHFDAGLSNHYGQTETSIDVTFWQCQRENQDGTVPLGHPIANTSIYILDPFMHPVPLGVPGELYIGGAGVARGYFNCPELTAERFVPNPFVGAGLATPVWGPADQPRGPVNALSGERLFWTGDLARYRSDGAIEYLGRIDYQVKLRGNRIELGEIEAVLRRHPAVQEAVVVAREDIPEDTRLVAYVVPDREHATPVRNLLKFEQNQFIEDIRLYVQQKLPDYMVPGTIMLLDALPLTPNEKVDRKALPAPRLDRSDVDETYQAPRSDIEATIAAIWAEVLGVTRVGIHDNFFTLGGHSLTTTRVLSRVREALEVELEFRSLFEAPTVAELVEVIQAQQIVQDNDLQLIAEAESIPRRTHLEDPAPLSLTQQSLWFLEQVLQGRPVYNEPSFWRIEGHLEERALQQALQLIVQRHEALRTCFVLIEEQPMQVITPQLELPFSLIDLRDIPLLQREETALRLLKEEACRLFDLERGPLIRACLLRLDDSVHMFGVVVHHIVFDGWSQGILNHELTTLYKACCARKPSPLPELAVQYADFAAWQRRRLQDGGLDEQLAYWKQQLAGAPTVLDLSTDRPRPAVQTFRGAYHSFTLAPALTAALKAFSQQEGCTLFMTLLAAFQLLLARYSGQQELLVGSPIANRTQAKVEGLIGYFANTLILRGDLVGNPSFRKLLARTRETCLGAYAHQDLPFEKLVEELMPERDSQRNPLFQVMFLLQNTPASSIDLEGVESRPLAIEKSTAMFDLSLDMEESELGLRGQLEYNSDLFDQETIEHMHEHFTRLLAGIVINPTQSISALPLLSDQEWQQQVVAWNATAIDYPHDRCMHELFEEQVMRSPNAIATIYGQEQLNYRELNARANQLAHQLRQLGVGPETLVALCAERSNLFLTAMLGVFKAGAAYLPLDPQHPAERLAQIIKQSGCACILISRTYAAPVAQCLASLPPAQRPRVLCLEEALDYVTDTQNLATRATPANLAYVIYTSGSTGMPKGAMVEQRGLLNHLCAKIEALQITADDTIAQTASQCFDISVWQFLAALLVGGSVQIYPDEVAHDPEQLLSEVERHSVSILETVPALLRATVEAYETSPLSRPVLKGLRWLIPTGEALPPELCRRWLDLYAHIPLLNAYGPTECSDDVAHYPIYHMSAELSSSVPIGRPIGNTQLYILDRTLSPLPIGAVGELYIGGDGVGRGYLGDAQRTAEVFVPNPFPSARTARRLYKTGDLARYTRDGRIEFLGRVDQQVKLRGYRLELGEIEAVLSRHPAVQAAVVVVRADIREEKRLVAYVVADRRHVAAVGNMVQAEQNQLIEDMRLYLQQKLPGYMLPTSIMLIDALPLTPNGKLDRKALPAPRLDRSDVDELFQAPRSDIEATIAAIWAEVLGVTRVGIFDDFFALGGHSLLATQVLNRLRRTFAMYIDVQQIFVAKTVAQLAELLVNSEPTPGYVATIARLRMQVRGLSAEEVRAQLAGHRG